VAAEGDDPMLFDQQQMQPTPFDLRWQMFGIPVRVHPVFWLVMFLLGPHRPEQAVLWVIAGFISILVHEMGHALSAKAYGSSAEILLYGFGGLAFHHLPSSWVGPRIAVLFAGPGAGFVLAGLAFGVGLIFCGEPTVGVLEFFQGNPFVFVNREAIGLSRFLGYMLWINIWWGLMNLLPVFPLDGGQITRIFLTWRFPGKGESWARQLSIGAAVCVVAFAIYIQDWYLAVLFGLLAFDEIQRYQMMRHQQQYERQWDRWE
jgi:membrane-associated protease RseP (regulator of RpoE activity)